MLLYECVQRAEKDRKSHLPNSTKTKWSEYKSCELMKESNKTY